MSPRYAEVTFTPAVKAMQEHYGSRASQARVPESDGSNDPLTPDAADFLERADHFYLASVSETGWPYVQHRGGPRGFVRVVSESQVAYADFAGNRQYLTAGNVSRDDRVSIIVMDYANRRRLKLLGRLRFVDVATADPALVEKVALPGYRARIERVALVDVVAISWNCPQHITPRYTLEEVESAVRPRY